MRRRRYTARKQELLRLQMRRGDPGGDRIAGLLGDLELNRTLRLLLHDNGEGRYQAALAHIMHAESNPIEAAQLAVDGEVEQCQLPDSLRQLQANPDGPDLFQLQRGL